MKKLIAESFAILRKQCFETPNLEPDELRELLIRAKAKDTDAQNTIIMAHMKHVFTYLERHFEFKSQDDYEECFILAYFSLYPAIRKYRFDKGTSFASYTNNWIRKAVLDYFESKKPKISNVQEVNRLIKAEEAYYKKYGLFPTIETLSEMEGKSPERIQKLLDERYKRERNYDVNEEYRDLLYPDKSIADNVEYSCDICDVKCEMELVRNDLSLDKRIDAVDLKIFDMMLMDGFGKADKFTTTRAAEILGITHQAVGERRKKIRKILTEYGLADLLHTSY
ncbi:MULTISPECIES: sigma-70 family RNA polymerase sigma factor [Clostridia]|uniref:sigma-70 family RNA polymerase sigma factor n=1 Tax=Clostridia TaxID=186801 RepID=UPI000E48B9E9|nr:MULTISPECIES: sigma factor [Clostridia]RHV70252.1 hypothetical protein DXB15_08095 [Roseburia sp. OM02-15]